MVGTAGSPWLHLERSVLRGLDAFGARFGPARHTPAHLRTGLRGETEALFFLRKHGYTVVARRWRCTEERGDLDLVAWAPGDKLEGKPLCFIEVKTRSVQGSIPAESAVDREKQRMLRTMARAYLRRMPREVRAEVPVRFDVVSVYLLPQGVECILLPGAFDWRSPPRTASH